MQLKPRLEYLDKELVEKLPSFVIEEVDTTTNFVRGRLKGLSILNLIKILYPIMKSPDLSFSELYYCSGIRMKHSFLSYLNFCKQFEFVTRTGIKRRFKQKHDSIVQYNITDKGRTFLNLFLKQEVQIVSQARKSVAFSSS